MRKLLLSFILVPFLFSCNPTVKKGAGLTGTVKNLTSGFFMLGGPGGAKDSIRPDATGKFTHSIKDLTEMANYYILSGAQDYMPFKVAPGMSLDISFDAAAFKTSLKFSGKGADINNYLVAKSISAGQMNYDEFKLEPDAYRVKQDSVLNAQKKLLADAIRDDANDPFWKIEEAEILFGWANNLSMYGSYHGYVTGIKNYKAPEEFYTFQKDLNLNNPEYVKSGAFKEYLSMMVQKAASDKVEAMKKADSTVTVNNLKVRMETAVELLKNDAVLDNYIYEDLNSVVQWQDIDKNVQDNIDFFVGRCKDTSLVNKLNRTVAEWKRLSTGQPAFDFTGKDQQGNTVKLSDFKGKLVYVDVWATWCGPCKYEIPYLDTLETDYHGKDIVFISYSIDEDYAAWMKFVPENKLQGVQIIGEKAWQSDLCIKYKIMGVPTFMLFDREGKIVSVKMTRPSDKKTREKFDSLL